METSSPRLSPWFLKSMRHHHLLSQTLFLCAFLLTTPWVATRADTVAHHDFSKGLGPWTPNPSLSQGGSSPDGLRLQTIGPDPFLVGPPANYPPGQPVTVTIRLRSTGDPVAQFYFGKPFSEANSRLFEIIPDGQWHEYTLRLPPLPDGSRLRFDPPSGEKPLELAWIRVETGVKPPPEAWATAAELRGKRMVCGGQFTTVGGDQAVDSRYLARHPEFTATFPYDGLIIPALIDAKWSGQMGLPAEDRFLHGVVWNATRIPPAAIDAVAADLNSVKWRGLTDNFLNYSMIDATRGRFMPDFTSDADWAVLEHNARQAARLCRLAGLKGFWLDTEQYGNYRWRTASGVPEFDPARPANRKFPLGKDTPEVLRKRGAQWIRAVQEELPGVKIIITFAWSPDANEYEPIQGANGFLNGILEGIQKPGQLIHGYENTFYFGQGPGTKHTREGFPGGRDRFVETRAKIRNWRAFSSNPAKYDSFLRTGMAAWVEDDPWSLWPGWPSGGPESFWSNLPLALAHSDEYVWVWSEHTRYGVDPKAPVNPFLSALRNRTFNTGREQAPSLAEDFRTDPLQNGWHFDFDMLAIAGTKKPAHQVPLMSLENLPYRWDQLGQALAVQSQPATTQRRRFVRPVLAPAALNRWNASIHFQVDQFGSNPDNPLLLGLFTADQPAGRDSLTLRLTSPDKATVVLNQNGTSNQVLVQVPGGLLTGKPYALSWELLPGKQPGLSTLRFSLTDPGDKTPDKPLVQTDLPLPNPGALSAFDEIGVALWETPMAQSKPAPSPAEKPSKIRIRQVRLHQGG